MIEAKQAAVNARDYYRQVTGYEGYVSVEEVELEEEPLGKRFWMITLGFPPQYSSFQTFAREYKSFRVDAETGDVVSMKIRSVAR
jgi:hypothetical protein